MSTSSESLPAATSEGVRAVELRSAYIVSPRYDWLLFLAPPLVAMIMGMLISNSWISNSRFEIFDDEFTPTGLFIGMMIHAHLVVVFFRSHANPEIFKLYRARFVLVPLLLFVGMVSSSWILISVSVLATFWDVYHSALQTFGFGRIYDARAGGDGKTGRRLDWWMNQLLYAGPILAGATMIDHFEDFEEFADVGATFFTQIPAFMEGNQVYFTWAVIGAGILFLAYYVLAQVRLAQRGHPVSVQKVYLLASTGLVSIYSWGFNSWGEAFFIMNFFHALQYFGIVWSREKGNMMRLFRVDALAIGKYIALVAFIGLAAAYGLWVELFSGNFETLWAITLVVSIMHFWYDGFIWSVQKRLV